MRPAQKGGAAMCHAKVTRTLRSGDGNLEFMPKEGEDWPTNPTGAYEVSEEDAKVFARIITQAAGAKSVYVYDYTTVDE